MSITFLLVRHGIKERTAGDVPITSEGKQQAIRTADREYIPPVGDSACQAGERLNSVLSELAAEHPAGSTVVIVTHGGLITDFLVGVLSESQLGRWHPRFITEQSTLIPECSITELLYDREHYQLTSLASVEHLTED
ncbi:histidine phosphatase family protein [Paenibacillus sp. Z6-24]